MFSDVINIIRKTKCYTEFDKSAAEIVEIANALESLWSCETASTESTTLK